MWQHEINSIPYHANGCNCLKKTLFFKLCLNKIKNKNNAKVNKYYLKITYLQRFSFKLILKKIIVTDRCNSF